MFITHKPSFWFIWILESLSLWFLAWDGVLLLTLCIFLSLCWLADSQVKSSASMNQCLNPPARSGVVQPFFGLAVLQSKPVEPNFASYTSRQGMSRIINLRSANLRASCRTESFEVTLNHLKLCKDSVAAEWERHFPTFARSPMRH